MDELKTARDRFVEELWYRGNLRSESVLRAFREVAREKFLGPGPWQIYNIFGDYYWPTPDAHPGHLYHDVLVAIDPKRRLNNGQPSGLAYLIEALNLQPGTHVVHLGCGTGYYTAIIAHVVGGTGRVTAIEIDAALASKATENLADIKQVTVVAADGSDYHFEAADAILVNAGVTHPVASWLERLRQNGKLLLPLTAKNGSGAVFKIVRREKGFSVEFVMGIGIFNCAGARDSKEEELLLRSLLAGELKSVRNLRLDSHPAESSCWFHTDTFCFSTNGLQ
jgi:protein-L-isoaspartate(D-aspartate) O-methyltransferase